MVLDGIAAARQLDPDGIVGAFARVVLDQTPAQATGLDAHECIGLRIEIRRPAENLDTDRITLQPLTAAGQRLLDDEAQEMRGATSLMKTTAGENSLELRAHVRRARLHCIVGVTGDGFIATRSTVGHRCSIQVSNAETILVGALASRSSKRRLESKGWT